MNNNTVKRPWKVQDGGYSHLLKHEMAFHNPGNMTPNEVLNVILDEYFSFVEKVRR